MERTLIVIGFARSGSPNWDRARCYNGEIPPPMLEESIQELESRSLERIASAATADELEAVRVDALGRKSGLTQFSKEMGKLAPEDRKRLGMLLNGARQKIEAA